jgi:hypothetical protein
MNPSDPTSHCVQMKGWSLHSRQSLMPLRLRGPPTPKSRYRLWFNSPEDALSARAATRRGDDRSRAAQGDVWWVNDAGQVGWFLRGYQSVWLPASLLDKDQAERLTDRLFMAGRQWSVLLHFNKGLAGAPHDAVAAARNTATNPAVLTAFALAIIVGAGPPAYPGVPGDEPDLGKARQDAGAIDRAMDALRKRSKPKS